MNKLLLTYEELESVWQAMEAFDGPRSPEFWAAYDKVEAKIDELMKATQKALSE